MNWCEICSKKAPWEEKCAVCIFELSDTKVIEYARERAISVTEAIALIKFCNSGFRPNEF